MAQQAFYFLYCFC